MSSTRSERSTGSARRLLPPIRSAIQSKVREEKARTLFLEGQRMGDLRRYLDQYGVDLFPDGPTFGDQTCMPLPNAERDNNPDI